MFAHPEAEGSVCSAVRAERGMAGQGANMSKLAAQSTLGKACPLPPMSCASNTPSMKPLCDHWQENAIPTGTSALKPPRVSTPGYPTQRHMRSCRPSVLSLQLAQGLANIRCKRFVPGPSMQKPARQSARTFEMVEINGCGSKMGIHFGTLVNGTKD